MNTKTKTRGVATKKSVTMSDILKPHEECEQPRTVLIEGKPGMGKTTYCKKLVYDWATGKRDSFPRFGLVMLLKCRDVGKCDLWDAIDDQLLPLDIQEGTRDKFFQFIRENQSNILLLLDGLDEVPSSKLPMFSKILQGRVLPKCRLVATARHEAGMKVRKYCDTLLEIEGFNEEDARNFIFKYFKTSKDLAEKLLFQLWNNKNLSDMAANPLNMALLCLLCEEFRGVFPERRTRLYLEMIECVLRRYRKKKGLSESGEDLTNVYKAELEHLGLIALNGLLNDCLDFEERELGKHVSVLPEFGFLSVQPGGSKLRPCRRYAFLHKSFQESFAAFYLCCQLLNKRITPESLASDPRYFNQLKQVLLFACGFLTDHCEETAAALIASITTQVSEKDSYNNNLCVVLDCITECKGEQSDVHPTLAPVFGSLLKLKTISIRWRVLGESVVTFLAEALKFNTSVTHLDLNVKQVGEVGATSLAQAIKVNTTLTQLDLSTNVINAPGATSLAEAMRVNATLKQLDLQHNRIGAVGAASLAEAMEVNTTLAQLDLRHNNVGSAGATSLAEAIKVNTGLTELDLSSNRIGDPGAASLPKAVKVNTTLTHLNLRLNLIGASGVTSLAEALRVNRTLTQLDLGSNGLVMLVLHPLLRQLE